MVSPIIELCDVILLPDIKAQRLMMSSVIDMLIDILIDLLIDMFIGLLIGLLINLLNLLPLPQPKSHMS